jgi:hypothetical protein
VPDAEQRLWRRVTRTKTSLGDQRKRVQCQVEGLLEEMMIKLSGVVSDLFGLSGRRILTAIANGEEDPVHLAIGQHSTNPTPQYQSESAEETQLMLAEEAP